MPVFFQKYILLFALLPSVLLAQQKASISGTIKTKNGEPIEGASVSVFGKPGGTTSDANGYFSLSIPANTDITIVLSFIGFNPIKQTFNLPPGTKKQLIFEMEKSNIILPELTIEEEKIVAPICKPSIQSW